MKQAIRDLIIASVDALQRQGYVADVDIDQSSFTVERTKQREHGDFACNVAMKLNDYFQGSPRYNAQLIVEYLPEHDMVERVEIAGPGFINFFIAQAYYHQQLKAIHEQGEYYGRNNRFHGQRAHVEFVSVNPTGPLHVGHGRNAVYGSALSRLLEAVGYEVHREYYVNDAGRQMNILTVSIWLRYLQSLGLDIAFPDKAYQGDYVVDIAQHLQDQYYNSLGVSYLQTLNDSDLEGDELIDQLVVEAKQLLGEDDYELVFQHGLRAIMEDINQDLKALGVTFDEWFSEQTLVDHGFVDKGIQRLRELGYVYEGNDGAVWFKSEQLGDDKDRVLVRRDGRSTYFASDVAYHLHKIERQYDLIVDVLGADHHGYIPRIKAAMQALGHGQQNFVAPIVQFASLYQNGEKLSMSTRSGSFVTLRQLREEVGSDATRYFYLMRKVEQPVDFDMDLAKSRSTDNPVFYVQYAHARIVSVLQQAHQAGYDTEELNCSLQTLSYLQTEDEQIMLRFLESYPDAVEQAAVQYDPHHLTMYLYQLAQYFHRLYSVVPIVVDDSATRQARLYCIQAIKQVLVNGLSLLTISAPDAM